MKIPYKSQSGDSGVISYELVQGGIILEFKHAKHRYLYDSASPGLIHVNAMRRLAAAGKGLTTYVSREVHEKYARKIPCKQ